MKKFIKNSLLLCLSTGIINIIEIITNAYITQKIGTTVIGSYSLITNVFNFLITISLFGIPLAIIKIVSEKDELKDNCSIVTATKISYKICAIISLIVCISTIFLREKIFLILLNGLKDTSIIILISLSLPFMALSTCMCGYFNALRKVDKPIITEFLSHVTRSGIIMYLIYIKSPTFKAFGLSIIISETVAFLYSYIVYKVDIKKADVDICNVSASQKIQTSKKIFRIATPISFTSFVRSGLSTVKHTLIPLRLQKFGFSYDYALSRYGLIHGIALPFVLMPSIFINCFSSLLLPEYSRLFVTKNIAKIQSTTERIFKITLKASLYISFLIYISSDFICYKIYKNTEVSYFVKVLLPLVCIVYLDYIVDNILRGLDLQVKVMKINIIDVIISISLIYFGVPYLGTFGYILVIYVSEYLNGVLSIELLLDTIKMKFKYLEWIFIPLLQMSISFFISNKIIPTPKNFLSILISIFIFSIIFLILNLLTKLLLNRQIKRK